MQAIIHYCSLVIMESVASKTKLKNFGLLLGCTVIGHSLAIRHTFYLVKLRNVRRLAPGVMCMWVIGKSEMPPRSLGVLDSRSAG